VRMSGQEERRERRLSLTNFAPEVIVECRAMKSEMNRPCCAGGLEVACKKRRRRNSPGTARNAVHGAYPCTAQNAVQVAYRRTRHVTMHGSLFIHSLILYID